MNNSVEYTTQNSLVKKNIINSLNYDVMELILNFCTYTSLRHIRKFKEFKKFYSQIDKFIEQVDFQNLNYWNLIILRDQQENIIYDTEYVELGLWLDSSQWDVNLKNQQTIIFNFYKELQKDINHYISSYNILIQNQKVGYKIKNMSLIKAIEMDEYKNHYNTKLLTNYDTNHVCLHFITINSLTDKIFGKLKRLKERINIYNKQHTSIYNLREYISPVNHPAILAIKRLNT